MEIKNLKTLVGVIHAAEPDEAYDIVAAYGNRREAKGISEAWDKARLIMRHIANARTKRIKNCLLEMDEYSNVIGIVPFTQFFVGVEDAIRGHYLSISDKEEALADINDLMYQLLDKVKIDRRLLASTNY